MNFFGQKPQYPSKPDRIEIDAASSPMPYENHVFTHDIITVGFPSEGYLTFVCSSNPKRELIAYERVTKCPFCRAHNPLKEGKS